MSKKRKHENYVKNICKNYKHGDIVFIFIISSKINRAWITLEVTERDIKNGIDVEFPGLYLFSGFWYGDNALDHNSYGKVIPLSGTEKVFGNFKHYKNKNLTYNEWDNITTKVFEENHNFIVVREQENIDCQL